MTGTHALDILAPMRKKVGVGIALLSSLLLLGGVVLAGDELRVAGVVRDATGGTVVGADISVRNAQEAIFGSTRTDAQGQFHFEHVPRGSYVLRVTALGFTERRMAVSVAQVDVTNIEVRLALAPFHEEITVTANPGSVEDLARISQQVNVIGATQIQLRVKAVAAQAVSEEAGAHLQRTSPTIAGVFVRGLTGDKVNVFVDGVRYSTSAMRGGINTFLDLVEPSGLEAVEILRGPSSAQYGSDALGGSVQFLSLAPSFAAGGQPVRATFSTIANSADASFGSNLALSYGARHFGLLTNLAARRVNTLRTGGGVDSHSAFTRFFGLPSDRFQGSRLPDTGFTQYGELLRLHWSPAPNTQFIAHYGRNQQDGGKRYDQLLGGDGNLVADLRNLMLDFFFLRWDQQRLRWLDHVSMTYSFNSQREERVNQGGNGDRRAAVNHEYERTRVHGVQGYLGKQAASQNLLLGAEYYHERLRSPSYGFSPATLDITLRRPRVPDRAFYQSGGIYLQDIFEVVPQRLRLIGSVRYSAASYRVRAGDSPLVDGRPLWPDDSLRASDVTFRTGIVGTPVTGLSLSANFSRGFRAPNMTDLGTLGLTGSGFEVAAPDVAGRGATIGSAADSSAISTGLPVIQVKPETSLTYELGARYRHGRIDTAFAFFVNHIDDNITKQALILPPGAVGTSLGGQTITAQDPSGVVFVGVSNSPVLVRANFDTARIYGFEHTFDVRLTSAWSFGGVFTYLQARDKRTGLPPNIEGGTPAPDGTLRIRYARGHGRWWLEPNMHFAARQDRLSSLDLEDRRTGATRSLSSIRNFFLNGATVRGFIGAGPDGIFGTADDVLLATGETLAQIQSRVLGGGVNSAPLFAGIPGYVTFNLRGGLRLSERQKILADFENIGDRNYRGISWGLDAPGRSFAVRYLFSF